MEGSRQLSVAIVLAMMVVSGVLGLLFVSVGSRGATYVVLSDGFENGATGWQVSDETPNSGLDYWGVSAVRASTGSSSVWCAQFGTNSVNGFPNSRNRYYDQDMDANLFRDIGDVSGYSSLSVTFSYWALTGSFSFADTLSVWEYTGGTWVQVWSQTSVDSGGWRTATATLSPASTAVDFLFHSDSTVGFGPYEGVYLDDVSVSGIDNGAPASTVVPLPPYETSRLFPVAYTAADTAGASGLASVGLYYSTSASGPWTNAGSFTSSPVSFSAPSDGRYYFYTVATDRAGNSEATPSAPDASTIVDATGPSVSISSPGNGQTLSSPTVGVTWTGSDATSGIDHYEIQLDGGSWTGAGTATSYTFNALSDGAHTVAVRAVDRAGNIQTATLSFTVNTNPFSPSGPSGGVALYSLILILSVIMIVVAIVALRRRQKSAPPPPTVPPLG